MVIFGIFLFLFAPFGVVGGYSKEVKRDIDLMAKLADIRSGLAFLDAIC